VTVGRLSLTRVLLACLVVASAVLATVVQRAKWWSLTTEWPLDLAFFHNILWNVAHGYGYRQSATWHERPGLWNETHFEPIVLLATGPTAVAGVTGLLASQATILALTAVPVAALLRPLGRTPALLGALALLLAWPFLRFGQADVRPLLWSLPFLAALILALRQRRARLALAAALLACLCREEIPLLVAATGVGFTLSARKGQRRLPLGVAATALLFLAVTTALRSNTGFYIRPGEWIAALLGPGGGDGGWRTSAGGLLPVRLRWLAEWLLPLWPVLLAPEALIGAGPLFVWLLTQPHEWATWEGPYIHHAAPAWALFGGGAALGAQRLHALLIRWLPPARVPQVGMALLGLTLVGTVGRTSFGWSRHTAPEIEPWRRREPEVAFVHALVARVPPTAPVMTDYGTVHLFAGRYAVYCYQQEEPEDVLPPPGPFAGPLLPRAEPDPTWALIREEHDSWVRRARALGLDLIDQGHGYLLFGPSPLGGPPRPR
jgi:hypothetical protein